MNDEGNTRHGWFRFLWERNGDLTFWGPCNKQGITLSQAQYVSVKPDMVSI